ncbi:MAG: oligosaccharide flippase family protein [Bacteroides sp.]|nr:oligosaccharide flippase family protein [Bacteroides sp.]
MNQLKAGAFLSYVVLALNTLVGLLYTPYLLRMLGQSEYGLYSLVASIITYLTILDLGFGNAIVRYTAKFRAENKVSEQYSMFGLFIRLYALIGIFTLIIGLALTFKVEILFGNAMSMEEVSKARIMMLLLTLNLAITFPFSLFGSIITAYENFVFQKIVQILRILLSTITMIFLLELGYRAIALVVVTTIFNVFSLFLNYFYCRYKLKIKIYFRKPQWSFLKEVSIYSFYIFLNAIMDRIYWSTGQFILGVISGTVAVAIYSVAITLVQMYTSFSYAISGVFLPRITAMVTHKESNKTISNLFIRTGRIQYIIISFVLTGFIVFGKSFILLWAGHEYSDAYFVALLFFIPLTAPLIQNLGISILQARNQMKFRSLLYIIVALFSLLISIFLTPKYGIIGCAVGTSLGLFLGQTIIMNIYYHRWQSIDILCFWKEILKMSIPPLFFGILSFNIVSDMEFSSMIKFLIVILIFSIFYFIIFWFFSMNNYEKDLFKGPVRKLLMNIVNRK